MLLTVQDHSAVDIREYADRDLDSVICTWERACEIGHPFLSEEFLLSERRNIPTVYLKTGVTWVAEIDNNVVGFSILHGNEIGALFVDPKFHGAGIGFALMNRAKEIHGDLIVEVFKENIIGKKFYLNYGFNFIREYLHEESGMIMLCLEYTKNS